VNHRILFKILKQRITDRKFLNLIKDMLKSGVMEKGTFQHSLNGTPQESIVSSLLFNVYMLGFDQYIYDEFILPIIKENENKPKREQLFFAYNKERLKTDKALKTYKKAKADHNVTKKQFKFLERDFKKKRLERNGTPYVKRTKFQKGAVYVRYADDWVLALTCTKTEALKIKEKIMKFLKEERNMDLDQEKNKITHVIKGYKFLGFEIRMNIKKPKMMFVLNKTKSGYFRSLCKTTSRLLTIELDSQRILKRLRLLNMCKEDHTPIGKPIWRAYDEFQIVQKYAQIFRGIFNYYEPCERLTRLSHVSYIL
jgi:hypothetical protein